MKNLKRFQEESKEIPIVQDLDVLVAGSGPAGIAAAIAAARLGARTALLEVNGCLGGVWTSGLLSWILDAHNKGGIMQEITDRLEERGAINYRVEGSKNFAYDVEEMKTLLEEMAVEAGVLVRLHTRVVAAPRRADENIAVVISESKSGREAWNARCFIDATGDGDLAFQAGCGFDLGCPETEEYQPMSLLALITGVKFDEISEFVGGGLTKPKRRLFSELERAGVSSSYAAPTLFRISNDLFTLMGNHQYGISCSDAQQITAATIQARAEIREQIIALRKLGGIWKNVRVVATAEQIGVREGRRIHGLYTITQEDLIKGKKHEDAVCRVTFGIDVHATNSKSSKDYDPKNKTKTLPYDIPLRALISKEVPNLLLAGRCISGDFLAHASYRVTGNAVAMGEAAGSTAAFASKRNMLPKDVTWEDVKSAVTRKVIEI